MAVKNLPEAKRHLLFYLLRIKNTDEHQQTDQVHVLDINEFYDFTCRQAKRLTHVNMFAHVGVASRHNNEPNPDGFNEKMNIAPRYWNDDLYFVTLEPTFPALPWTTPIEGKPSVKGGWLTSSQLIQAKENWPFDFGQDYDSGNLTCEVHKTDVINPITGKPRIEFSFTVNTPQNITSKPGLAFDFILMLNGFTYSGEAPASKTLSHSEYKNRVDVTLEAVAPIFAPYL